MPAYTPINCKLCKKDVLVIKGCVFCSRSCYDKDRDLNKNRVSCKQCKKIFPTRKIRIQKFCSRKCQKEWLKTNHGNRWKGGHISEWGYVRVWDLEKNGLVFQHRLVMEKYLGRKLKKHEVVHHKDHNKLNNDVSNLEVLDRGKHSTMHNIERRKTNKPLVLHK